MNRLGRVGLALGAIRSLGRDRRSRMFETDCKRRGGDCFVVVAKLGISHRGRAVGCEASNTVWIVRDYLVLMRRKFTLAAEFRLRPSTAEAERVPIGIQC